MIRISHIAIPYSRALFDLSKEKNMLEEAYKDIQVISSICKSNPDFRMMLKSPLIFTSKKVQILKLILENRISDLILSYFIIIVRKKREALIPDIALDFIRLYKNQKGILPAVVETAGPLTEPLRKKILEVMKKYTEKEIELTEQTDESLIGGFILQWDDKQYDASVRRQLKEMKKNVGNIGG